MVNKNGFRYQNWEKEYYLLKKKVENYEFNKIRKYRIIGLFWSGMYFSTISFLTYLIINR